MSDDGKSIVKEQESLADKRRNFDTVWDEIARYVLPREAQFTTIDEEGVKRTERLFDGSAVTANERFASAMEQMLTPRTQQWHRLRAEDVALRDDQELNEYFDEVTKILFAARYAAKANFASQTHEGYMSLGAFGNHALFVDDDVGIGMRYRAIHLREIVWAENHQGIIDRIYRRYEMQARQALMMFGDQCPPKVRQDAEKDQPFKTHEFIHCVRPNEELKSGRADYTGMAWQSWYVFLFDNSITRRGGYKTFPYGVGRYVIGPRESYGRGPAMACLPAIKTLNEQKKSVLRAGQLAVEPPILLHEDGVLEAFNLRPSSMNYGMLTNDGTPLAIPFNPNPKVDLGIDLMELEAKFINDSFLVTLFQILVENQQMTATEALLRAQEKGALLAPTAGRQQSEYLGPIIEREIQILSDAGRLPPPPDQLLETEGRYAIVYESPLTRAQRAEEGMSIMNTLSAASSMVQVVPDIMDNIDTDEAIRDLAEINGMPTKLLRDPEDVAAIREQRQKQEQAMALAEAAPGLTQADKNAAQAEEIAGAQPQAA